MDPFTPDEAEFLAEFTKIEIIPAGSLAELDLISVSPLGGFWLILSFRSQ